MIPKAVAAMSHSANAVTHTGEPCAVSQTDCLAWPVSFCGDRRRLIRSLVSRPHETSRFDAHRSLLRFLSSAGAPFLRSLIAAQFASIFGKPSAFQFGWKRPLFRPGLCVPRRRAQLRSRLAAGHRAAAQGGLDGCEHGATLDQVGRLFVPGSRFFPRSDQQPQHGVGRLAPLCPGRGHRMAPQRRKRGCRASSRQGHRPARSGGIRKLRLRPWQALYHSRSHDRRARRDA